MMIRLPSGFWVPEGAYGARFFSELGADGLPTHSADRITACVDACSKRRRRVAIDGGAYVGMWSLHLAKHFRTVIAYEPADDNLACLRLNTLGQLRIKPQQLALTATDGPMEWAERRKRYGGRVQPWSGRGIIQMGGRALDSINMRRLDLLKLDVEGHEYEALHGARATLQRLRPVVMIEEKLDPQRRATALLLELGMRLEWSKRHDYLFVW